MTGDGTQKPRSSWLSRLWSSERGQGLIEYALIISLVSLSAIVALGFFSGKIQDVFFKSGNTIANMGAPPSGTTLLGPGPIFTVFNDCTVGNSYVYLAPGAANDTPQNILGQPVTDPAAWDGFAGMYSCVQLANPNTAPTHFEWAGSPIWSFDCKWHGLFVETNIIQFLVGHHQWTSSDAPGKTFLQGCFNLPAAPVNTAPPIVSGTASLGANLTTTNGSWNPGASSFDYQWQRTNGVFADCSLANGATSNVGSNSQNFTVPNNASQYQGHCIRVQVTAQDSFGQQGTPAPVNSPWFGPIQDLQPPTLTTSNFSNSPTNNNTLTFRINGDENINCATVSGTDFNLTNATFVSATQLDSDTCTITLTSTIANGSSGTSTVNDTGGTAIADTAGNMATNIGGLPANWTVDHQGPVLTGSAITNSPTSGNQIQFRITGNENINCTTIGSGDFSLSSNVTFGNSSGGTSSLNCTVTLNVPNGTPSGTVTVNLGGGFSVQDALGNASTTAGGFPLSWQYDAPTTFFGTRVTPSPGGTTNLVFTITATRPINCSQLTSTDFSLSSGGMSFVSSAPAGLNSTCTVTVTSNVNFGSQNNRSVDLNNFQTTDSNGNTVDSNDESPQNFPLSWNVDRRVNATRVTPTPFTGPIGTTLQFTLTVASGEQINCTSIASGDFSYTRVSFGSVSPGGNSATCTINLTTTSASTGAGNPYRVDTNNFNVTNSAGNTTGNVSGFSITWIHS